MGFPWKLLTYHRDGEHDSPKDPNPRFSAQIFSEIGKFIGSVHLYLDGRIVYSKKKLNDAQKPIPEEIPTEPPEAIPEEIENDAKEKKSWITPT